MFLNEDPKTTSNVIEINGKVGESTNIWSQDKTVLGYTNVAYQHIHKSAQCYPSLADGVVIAGGAGVWTLGDFVEIIPENAIPTAFDIHWIIPEEASASTVYELVLYSGTVGNEVEIARVRTRQSNPVSGAISIPVQIPPQVANSRISAKLASAVGGSSLTISLFYHQYS